MNGEPSVRDHAVVAAKSQPDLYVYPRLVRTSSHEIKPDTNQNATNHRNLQWRRNDPENGSLQQKGDSSTPPLCWLIQNQHKKYVRSWCPDQSPVSSPPFVRTGGTADQDSTGLPGDFPDGGLADFREYCVEELGGECRSDAGGSVYMSRVSMCGEDKRKRKTYIR